MDIVDQYKVVKDFNASVVSAGYKHFKKLANMYSVNDFSEAESVAYHNDMVRLFYWDSSGIHHSLDINIGEFVFAVYDLEQGE